MSQEQTSQLDALGATLRVPGADAKPNDATGASTGSKTGAATAAKGGRTAKGAAQSGAAAGEGGGEGTKSPGNRNEGGSKADASKDGHGDDDAPLPPMPQRDAPGYFRFMPPLVQELWNRGAELNLDRSGEFLIEGFYRNGALRLLERDGQMVAIDRRNRESVIQGFDDLARINHQWWCASSKRGQYVVPNRPWLDHFIQNKWAKRQVIYVPALDAGAPTIELEDDEDQRTDNKQTV